MDDARRGRLFALRNLCTTTSFLAGLAVNLNGRLLTEVGPAHLIAYTGVGAIVLAVRARRGQRRDAQIFLVNSSTEPAEP